MDKKDKRILAELMINSRTPINRLAKKVGVSREVASYRFNNLIKQNIITSFNTIINTEKLGFSINTVLFQLKGITHEKEKEFMEYLIKHDFVSYMGPTIGKWNLAFDLYTKNKEHLETLMKEITKQISPYIENYIIISSNTEIESFPTKTLGINKQFHFKKDNKKVDLDKKDLQILSLLSNNSRIEYKEISKQLDLGANAIKYRIKNLEKLNVIQGYTLSVDIKKLGYEWHNIQLKLIKYERDKELKGFLKIDPRVMYFYKHIGHESWNFDVGVIVKDSLMLRDFLLELREKFCDVIKLNDTYILMEELKGNYAPKGLF